MKLFEDFRISKNAQQINDFVARIHKFGLDI